MDVCFDEIFFFVIDVLVVMEDVCFFEYSGIDFCVWGWVLVKIILFCDELVGGGSIFSQQLVKNFYLCLVYWMLIMFINKIKEMFMVCCLEQLYIKEELLCFYFNIVFFGDNVYGIKVVLFCYFNSLFENLSIEEVVMLVGMFKGMSYYNLCWYLEVVIECCNVVFIQFYCFGKLEVEELDSLKVVLLEFDY